MRSVGRILLLLGALVLALAMAPMASACSWPTKSDLDATNVDFAEAIQNVPEGMPAPDVMGDYFPQVRYCSTETFESGGAGACLG